MMSFDIVFDIDIAIDIDFVIDIEFAIETAIATLNNWVLLQILIPYRYHNGR